MSLFSKLFDKTLRMSSSSLRSHRVADGIALLDEDIRGKGPAALELALGKQWKRLPTRSMMDVVHFRFGTKPGDHSDEAVKPLLLGIIERANKMSHAQRQFMQEFDHLPGSMNDDQLMEYKKKDDEEIHKKKTDYFIMMNGVIQAFEQKHGTI